MTDETNPDALLASATGVEEPETTDESTTFQDDDGQPEGQAPEPEEEMEEVERDGKKYRVPKALRDELLMHADYTRKTQELADLRRAAEADRLRLGQVSEQHVQGLAQIRNIDQQLAAFTQVDWQQLAHDDPARAQQLFFMQQQIRDNRQQLLGQLQQQEQVMALEAQREIDKRIEEGQTHLAREIPNWSPDTANQLIRFAVEQLGFQPEEVNRVIDHRQVKMLHMAWLGQQLLAQQKAGAPTAPVAKPVPSVSGKSSGARDMTRMSTDEWMRARNSQLRKTKG